MSNQFENNSFKVTVEEQPGCQVQLKVEISKEQVGKAYKQAIKKINKEVSIPGFRKGKAPDDSILKKHGAYVEQEWKEILVNDALRGSLDLTKIYPLNKDSIKRPKIESCSLENGAVVTLSYERYPEIPVIDFSKLEVPSIEKRTVDEKRIEEILEEVQRAHADFEDISGRSVEEGDYVDLTIDAIDQDPPRPIVKDRRFEVSESKMISWLRNLVVGMELGQVKEGTSELDNKADDEVRAKFKPTHCRVTLNAIKKIILPELNDELAKKAGGSSVEDLKQKIAFNLEQEIEQETQDKRYNLLEEALLKHYSFDIPSSMVEAEVRYRTKERIRTLKQQNFTEEEIKSKEQEILQEASKEANEAIRLYFLSKQITQQGKITVTNQELNQELIRQISYNPNFYNEQADKGASQELLSRIASNLMQKKAREYALAQVASH